MNDMENLRTFADQLWKYMVPKINAKLSSNVSYFRAEVVSNPGNNKLEVQRPVENGTLTLPCVRAMSGAQVGQQVVALVMGSMSNAIIVGDGKLNVPGGGGDAGIANFQAQPDGSLVITLTDGTTFTATPVMDDVPTQGSDNPVKSGGIYTALAGKQDTLTFDDTPTANSSNPVKSSGIKSALDNKVDKVAGKGLSTNDYTTADKNKLAGIEAGAQVNQNSFANVKVGSTTVAADAEQDTLELVAGNNITITPDATNDKVTIAAKDTTYSSKAAASGGTEVSLVTTGEKYNWNSKANGSHTHTTDAVTDLVTATQYGPTGLASFNGREGLPLKSWLVDIEPAQEGSGDPSPSNIRPISGWTGAKVRRFGKNMLNFSEFTVNKREFGITFTITTNAEGAVTKITANGTDTAPSNNFSQVYIQVPGAYAKHFSGKKLSGGYSADFFIQIENVYSPYTAFGKSEGGDVTIGSGVANVQAVNILCRVRRGATLSNASIYPMIRDANDSDSTFEPYKGQTIDYTFPTEAGTVYGGTLDVLKGTLTVNTALVTLTGNESASYTWGAYCVPVANAMRSEYEIIPVACTHTDNYITGNRMWRTEGSGEDVAVAFHGRGALFFRNRNVGTTLSAYQTYLRGQASAGTPVQVVYKIATPITYQLTPELVAALAGQNNFWCDAGDVTVEYGAFLAAAEGAADAGRTYTDLHYVTAGQKSGTTLGNKATAEGNDTTASDSYAHAEGNGTTASNVGCHAEGFGTTASGMWAHAEGDRSKASGNYSHAEGYGTTASNGTSHAEGNETTASGPSSHAEGNHTTASGTCSHAEGDHTTASMDCQHVFGKMNVPDNHCVEVVGWGTNSTQKNIRTLDTSGNMTIAGTLTQNSDARLKDVAGEIPDVSGIRAVRFKWNDTNGEHDDRDHIGYLAQDVEGIAPYLVDVDSNGYKSLDYIALLTAKVEMLEREIEKLKQ